MHASNNRDDSKAAKRHFQQHSAFWHLKDGGGWITRGETIRHYEPGKELVKWLQEIFRDVDEKAPRPKVGDVVKMDYAIWLVKEISKTGITLSQRDQQMFVVESNH